MGRSAHLKQSLPRFLDQCLSDFRIYIVDWSSPDDLEPWLEGFDPPRTHILHVRGKQFFHLAAARNVGGRQACDDGARYLAFIDADILVPEDFLLRNWGFIKQAREAQGDRFFLQTRELTDSNDNLRCIWGSCIVPASLWLRDQYNEEIRTYGHEDTELYSLWLENGIFHLPLDVIGVRGISHDDEERVRYYDEEAEGLKQRKQRNIGFFRGMRGNLFG
jgi:glycosyltransferase involved in cell wall biosynthesis